MEKNYISKYEETHFYIDIARQLYGVCININDIDSKDEIIAHFKTTRKKQIQTWLKEWGLENV